MTEQNSISRRDALKQFVLLCGAAGALTPTLPAQAADLPHLSMDDPTAKALGYNDSSKAVDAKKYSNYVRGSSCANCLQLQGAAGAAYRPCDFFQGKLVAAAGWCTAWAAEM